jgi:caffeoyl-CoA O-methyltransferase
MPGDAPTGDAPTGDAPTGDNGGSLARYVEGLFAREDDLLRELREESERQGLPPIQVSAEVGRLLQVLLATVGARRVLEVGTLGGYSAIWMARALPPGGHLTTLEVDPERAAFARRFFARAGLEGVVDVRVGDARETLAGLTGRAAFDAVFIDADKESYGEYLDHALRLVRPGGLILADNAFRSGMVLDDDADDPGVLAVRHFNTRLARDPRLAATILPVRDGIAVAVVRE